jgi:sodium/bile acid cotransporter 7
MVDFSTLLPKTVTRFITRYWFLIGLATVLLIGFSMWQHLLWFASLKLLRNLIVACVLFLMAWPLESSTMWQAIRRPWAATLAFGVNFGLLPLIAWACLPLLRDDLAVGLIVAAAAPCTLASAAVWTRQAGGNDAVALLVTIATNLLCFLLTPLWLLLTIGRGDVKFPAGMMIAKLAILVVVPIVAAQLSRLHGPVASWSTQRKPWLSILAQCGILTIVLVGAIQAAERIAESQSAQTVLATDLLWMIVLVCTVHVVALTAGLVLARVTGLRRPDRIAVAFAGSQKTLMVGLFVATSLEVTILPMVGYHVSQLLIDTLVADRMRATTADKQ